MQGGCEYAEWQDIVYRNTVARSHDVCSSSAIKQPDTIWLEESAFMAIYSCRQH
jgi:hypothetical protein